MTDSEHTEALNATELQSALEKADPAEAPEIAETLADALGDDLDQSSLNDGTSS
ncbi:MAG: hypothetical protein ACR2N2_12795 [Acidimicrobiia bacterium]